MALGCRSLTMKHAHGSHFPALSARKRTVNSERGKTTNLHPHFHHAINYLIMAAALLCCRPEYVPNETSRLRRWFTQYYNGSGDWAEVGMEADSTLRDLSKHKTGWRYLDVWPHGEEIGEHSGQALCQATLGYEASLQLSQADRIITLLPVPAGNV